MQRLYLTLSMHSEKLTCLSCFNLILPLWTPTLLQVLELVGMLLAWPGLMFTLRAPQFLLEKT